MEDEEVRDAVLVVDADSMTGQVEVLIIKLKAYTYIYWLHRMNVKRKDLYVD